jgi:hypothetical protein
MQGVFLRPFSILLTLVRAKGERDEIRKGIHLDGTPDRDHADSDYRGDHDSEPDEGEDQCK